MTDLKIKWIRLEKILEELCDNRIVSITLTTHELTYMSQALTWQNNLPGPGIGEESISAVSFNEMEANFFLDGRRVKSEDMVIKALAHEVAHVILNDASHNTNFKKKWKEVRKEINKRYFKNEEDTDK